GWLDDLNPEQRRAGLHDDGHLVIVAGPGSGKTRTLACRVARLLAGGARPERILLLTFSRRAARDMLTRAAQLAEAEGARRVWGGTFHSVANRLLRRHGAAVGLRSGFTVLDQGDNADLLGLVRHELGLGERGRRFPKKDTLAAVYSRVVNAQAIYGFRSGSARHMIEFPERFAGATIVTLDRNYRSTPAILASANAVMKDAHGGYSKQLRSTRPPGSRPALATCVDELAQSAFVCESVLEHRERGVALHEQAVLFRTGHHSDRPE